MANTATVNGLTVTFRREGAGRYLVVAENAGIDGALFALGTLYRNDDDGSWSPDGSRVRYNTRADAAGPMVDSWRRWMRGDA